MISVNYFLYVLSLIIDINTFMLCSALYICLQQTWWKQGSQSEQCRGVTCASVPAMTVDSRKHLEKECENKVTLPVGTSASFPHNRVTSWTAGASHPCGWQPSKHFASMELFCYFLKFIWLSISITPCDSEFHDLNFQFMKKCYLSFSACCLIYSLCAVLNLL